MRGSSTRLKGGVTGWAATTCLLILLSACSLSPGSGKPGGSDEPAGCGSCDKETSAVGDQISQIDGVTDPTSIRYSPPKVPTRLPVVVINANIAADSLNDVRPAMVKAIWNSRITPLDRVTLQLETPNRDLTVLNFRFTRGTKDYTTYRDAWGPRPTD